ncbi:hypothetical protein EK21DRAFT_88962 [Setomelanomma holmii]|uniref:Uncharacterized protein n=1 Tax=Setomelanomma holmii TaxID=210430 RepID=A0A9P4HBA7_9PLEO|nr:hypothetical protein EK21DRAFT_88962 [Setomelanomma holmii]
MMAGYDPYGTRPWHGNWPRVPWWGLRDFRNLINNLLNQGYLNTPAFQPIVAGPMRNTHNVHGEINAGTYPSPQIQRCISGPRNGLPNIWNCLYGTSFQIHNFHQGYYGNSAQYHYGIPMLSYKPQAVEKKPRASITA